MKNRHEDGFGALPRQLEKARAASDYLKRALRALDEAGFRLPAAHAEMALGMLGREIGRMVLMRQAYDERRLAERFDVVLPVSAEIGGIGAGPAAMTDLSRFGCGLRLEAGEASPGANVRFIPFGDVELCGEVRWSSGSRAGIAFEHPLAENDVHRIGCEAVR